MCQRTFNALSTTPPARLRMQGKWLQQQDVLLQGLSESQAAGALNVADTTAFRWRHRFPQLAQSFKPVTLVGVVEADETFLLRSSKGQRPRAQAPQAWSVTRKELVIERKSSIPVVNAYGDNVAASP